MQQKLNVSFVLLIGMTTLIFGYLPARADELTPPATTASPGVSAGASPSAESAPAPLAYADFSWIPGNYGPSESPMATKYFTPELRLDAVYNADFSNPKDHSISGSSEVFRSNELQVTQIGLGGDFNYNNVNIRLMTQFGMYSEGTPRNDASPARGQWNLDNAYRYISEAYAGYHLDVLNGINIQAGIFMSYVGLWSYYNFDNWTYQPSFVSSNTPWYFNGMRFQIFTSDKLKIEPWLINGWQSYGMVNNIPGIGLQLNWRPTSTFSVLGNQYYGSDAFGDADRRRFHTDDSVMKKYLDHSGSKGLSQAAASFTFDAGFESGGQTTAAKSHFVGFMAYNRFWFNQNHYGLTLGGGAINNPGRYLVLTPPINGATAFTESPYFSQNPGDPFWAWDSQITADYMPNHNLTFRLEFCHRYASVPYFSGSGGLTPPNASGGVANNGNPTALVSGWAPDLTQVENRITAAMMVRF